MKNIDLNRNWEFREYEAGSRGDFCTDSSGKWYSVDFPGDINQALVRHGVLPDPHYDMNGLACYWTSSKDWCCRKKFSLDMIPEKSNLLLEGIDGHAELYLNGEKLGKLENAFRPHRLKLNGKLKKENTLVIYFLGIDGIMGGPRNPGTLEGWRGQRSLMRKAQYNFGWDWALPLPGTGVMEGISIEYDTECRFKDFSIRTDIKGRIDFFFELSKDVLKQDSKIEISLSGHGCDFKRELKGDKHKCYSSFKIANPALWNPAGYGAPNLYDYEIKLISSGEVQEVKKGRTGIRSSRIKEDAFAEKNGTGFSFALEINGVPVFCKGSNWIPMELWPSEIKEGNYRYYLSMMRDAGFNMVRVWGGGIYEKERFYELCDEYGIMVWQDFMFASAWYDTVKLRDEIMAEAHYQVGRIGLHPSPVIWCGCNEDVFSWNHPDAHEGSGGDQDDAGVYCDMSYQDQVRARRLKDDPILYSMMLRGILSFHDPAMPYVESSPQSHDDGGNSPSSGNSHLSCLKYLIFNEDENEADFRGHFEKVCSFDSEFCINGPCSEKTLRNFMKTEHHWPPGEAWKYHIQHGHRNMYYFEQINKFAGRIFGEINNLHDYTKYGQAMHAEMMKSEFEAARHDRPDSGGTMFWMYNDCWPTSNWSVIDYYRRVKPSYYAAKRACAEVLPIIFMRKGIVDFSVSNDSVRNLDFELELGQENLRGEKIWTRRASVKNLCNGTESVFSIDCGALKLRRDEFLYMEVKGNASIPKAVYFMDAGTWKDIKWPDAELEMEITGEKNEDGCFVTELKISSKNYGRFVHLYCEDEQDACIYSDNYFDLPAGSTKSLLVRSAKRPELKIGDWNTNWH